MAGKDFDPNFTVVISNIPADVGEDELTIHLQKERNGGGDIDDVVLDEGGSVAFVVFDLAEVASSVVNHKQIIHGTKVQVESYQLWLTNKKKKERSADIKEESHSADKVFTIYVSGFENSTTDDAIMCFFENKRRSGGGELREDDYKRISPTLACLTFVNSKDAENVLKKASETPLQFMDGNLLKVSAVLEPTHDRSILFANNLNPHTSEETFRNFVETNMHAEVLNVVLGRDGKAIVILRNEIEEDSQNEETSSEDMNLDGSIISMEFAPVTKGITIRNIPSGTSHDDIKFKFSNPMKGGGKVTDLTLDKKNGSANICFVECSVVSRLVKMEHKFKGDLLTVFPYYDDFQEIEEAKTKTTEYSSNYSLEPVVWDFIMNHFDIKRMFNFKSMKYVEKTATFYFSKEFDDSKDAAEFEKKVKEFLNFFHKEEVKIPSGVFNIVKVAIESKRHEFRAAEIDVKVDSYRVILIGKKEQVIREKQSLETLIDKVSEDVNRKQEKMEIEDKNKLKFLNFIDYFKKLTTEFPSVQISSMKSLSGNLTLYGTPEKIKDVQLRIWQDLAKITEIDVKTSDRQIDFLNRTDCKIANDELKKDDVMLVLIPVKGAVGAKRWQAKIMTLKKCDDNEEKRLVHVALAKTSEKRIRIDADTARFLLKSDNLQALIKEQFEKHQVMIAPELIEPCNIWIVCEKSKMKKAEQDLAGLTDEKKITSSAFKPMDPMKIRFLKEHCWDKIKEKEHGCKEEGVEIVKGDNDSFEIKGTRAGRQDIISFLEKLAGKVDVKTYPLNEPGMKKQMSTEITNAIILEIEKNHKCIIEPDIQPEIGVNINRTTGQTRYDAPYFAPINVFGSKKHAKSTESDGPGGISFKIYSDDLGKIDKAWGDLKRKIMQNIQEKPLHDDVIKKFSDGELEKIRKLECDYDVQITPDKSKGRVMVKGHITDIATIHEKIRKLLKDFAENESKVASNILERSQVIKGKSVQVQSYQSWQESKKKQEKSEAKKMEDSRTVDTKEASNVVTTIYVSGFKDATTEESITLFFENRKRSGGGELCPGKDGYKRISPTVARLTYASAKDAENVLKKANETPLKLDGNLLKVSTILEPTHDRSILLAKNLNPQTSEETLKNFVEVKRNTEVHNIVFGKDGNAIVILKNEIDGDSNSDEESSGEDMKLEGSFISLEFAPLTKGIRINNIPPKTSPDAIRLRFSNPTTGGSKVSDMMLDKKNGVANIYFEDCSVVSKLVKKEHTYKNTPLTMIPYYDDFEVKEEATSKITEFV